MGFRLVFPSVKRIQDFLFPSHPMSLVIFARQLFTSLHVAVARLYIMAEHHAILSFAEESILGLTIRVKQSKAFRCS